jgi:hypothetical protein
MNNAVNKHPAMPSHLVGWPNFIECNLRLLVEALAQWRLLVVIRVHDHLLNIAMLVQFRYKKQDRLEQSLVNFFHTFPYINIDQSIRIWRLNPLRIPTVPVPVESLRENLEEIYFFIIKNQN